MATTSLVLVTAPDGPLAAQGGGSLAGFLVLLLLTAGAHVVLTVVTLVVLVRNRHDDQGIRTLRRLTWVWAGLSGLTLLGMLPHLFPTPVEGRLFGLRATFGSSAPQWHLLLVPAPAAVIAALVGWTSRSPRSLTPRMLSSIVSLLPVCALIVAPAVLDQRRDEVDQQAAQAQAAAEARAAAEALESLRARSESHRGEDARSGPITPDPDDGTGPIDVCGRAVARDTSWLIPECPRERTDHGLRNLGALHELRRLDLGYSGVTNAGLAPLHALIRLRDLSLMLTEVSDAGLRHLADLTQLEALNLSRTKVTGRGFVHLTGLVALRELDLDWAPISDGHLHHLRHLTALRELTLSRTQITDAGLEVLAGLSTLETLDVSADGVTEGAVARLRQRLPECEIVSRR